MKQKEKKMHDNNNNKYNKNIFTVKIKISDFIFMINYQFV